MTKIMRFGETVEGYDIPVLNEREIRAAAGIYFLVIFIALMLIVFKGDFLLIKYSITFFLTDFLIRVFINPRYSPSLIIGRMIVNRQNPEYVSAAPKKLAWMIGVALSATMFLLMVIVNSYSIITGLICLICLIFLFFESVFGICLGCLLYGWIYKEKARYCPGEICDAKTKIQKTSWMQIGIVAGFIVFIFVITFFFNSGFSEKPSDLWEIVKTSKHDG